MRAGASPLSGPIDRRQWVIKRVAAVPGDPRPDACPPATVESPEGQVPPGKLVLLGDNPAWSHDSRQMGYFPAERLLGVVVRRIARGQHRASSYPGDDSNGVEAGPAQDGRAAAQDPPSGGEPGRDTFSR